ncbi:putative mitochondrial acetolactate synthase small subunit protein [Neofusicoccum parvum UCRNP2]|uniref:Putative mitochondrial acetolactate synthase small subunit protein n=1 Tax=Botryosphaeria parva (strain UCR-NP2) TaxID=1287680 RepID=R1EQP8_BOTPV|nr:putative mitochondrial acetolactate synthase small subunit protein [Neofusicoccum parvum UCRNP2]
MASRRALNALPLRSALHKPAPALATPAVRPRHQPNSSSSTQALAYKALHRRIAPLPTSDAPPSWSAPAAVSSILYETPLPSQAPPKRHVLNCLVQNEPGVLSRVSGILAARGFNIDSLVVCNTEVPDLSRMTIVLQGQDGVVEQARRQLEDLVPVWAVLDYTQAPLVQRELLLAKVSILGPEYFEELMQHHREMVDSPGYIQEGDAAAEADRGQREQAVERSATEALKRDFHPSKLAVSQALRHKHEHLEAITHLTHQFGGKVLDISTNNCIVEVSAKPARIDSFMKLVAPFGILESARTGLMALPRSPLAGPDEAQEKEIEDVVDQSMLPPG